LSSVFEPETGPGPEAWSTAAETLYASHLFAGLAHKEVDDFLEAVGEPVKVDTGGQLLTEGDPAVALYILLEGRVAVLRKDPRGTEHVIRRLRAVQAIGDVSMFDHKTRSATVRAMTPCRLIRIPFQRLDDRYPADATIGGRFRANVATGVMWEFREMGSSAVEWLQSKLEESEKRVALGHFVVKLIVPVVLYMFMMAGISWLVARGIPASLVAVPLLAMFGLAVTTIIRGSPYPASSFGLTFVGWRRAVGDGLLLTLPVLATIVGMKLLLLRFSTAPEKSLFDLGAGFGLSRSEFWTVAIVYSLFAPVQELVARCGVQVPFEMFLEGPRKHWTAILLSSMIFSATHLHEGVAFALSVFPMGVFWGWMFRRHQNLFGVCLSHVLVGNFAFLIVGFWGILY
jgi:CRP-like cAMP-binding protein/membrane protease YdiL (CAAX protease family)